MPANDGRDQGFYPTRRTAKAWERVFARPASPASSDCCSLCVGPCGPSDVHCLKEAQ